MPAAVGRFRMKQRQIKFTLPLPSRDDPVFTMTPTKRNRRSEDGIAAAYEQAVRQRWRALLLAIKAKLEAVETGITEFDDEFLAHIMLPSGETFGQWAKPQLQVAYDQKQMPGLLPDYSS